MVLEDSMKREAQLLAGEGGTRMSEALGRRWHQTCREENSALTEKAMRHFRTRSGAAVEGSHLPKPGC